MRRRRVFRWWGMKKWGGSWFRYRMVVCFHDSIMNLDVDCRVVLAGYGSSGDWSGGNEVVVLVVMSRAHPAETNSSAHPSKLLA